MRSIGIYLLLVLFVTLLTSWLFKKPIEDDLEQNFATKFSGPTAETPLAKLDKSHATFSWFNGKLGGASPSETATDNAVAFLKEDRPEAWLDTSGLKKAAIISQAQVVAQRDGEKITLTGTVPSEGVRTNLGDAATTVPGVTEVDNQLTLDTNSAAGWLNGAPTFFGNFLDITENSSATLGKSAVLTGSVGSEAVRDALGVQAESLSSGFSVDNQLQVIIPAAEEFNLSYVNGAPSVSGVVRSPDIKAAIGQSVTDVSGIAVEPGRLPAPWSLGLGKFLPDFLKNTSNPKIEAKGPAFTMSGKTTPLAKENIERNLATLAPNLEFTSNFESASPAVASIVRGNDGSITLEGTVENDAAKAGLGDLAANQFRGAKITNNIKVSADRTAGWWNKSAPWLTESVFTSTEGPAYLHLRESDMDAGGMVAGNAKPEALGALLKGALPGGVGIATAFKAPVAPAPAAVVEITPSPKAPASFVVSAAKPGTLVVSGRVPSEGAKNALIKNATDAADGRVIKDEVVIDPQTEARPWLPSLTGYLPGYLSGVDTAGISATGDAVTIEGNVPSKKEKDDIGNSIARLIGNKMTLNNRLEIVAPEPEPSPVAVDNVRTQLKELQVYFDTNSDVIKKSEAGKVEQAAKVILSLPKSAKLIVGGHADPRGNADYNKKLSIRRASSVRDQLVKLGVSTDRMVVQSFGESDAVEQTGGDVNNNLSRRVEIRVSQ